MKNIEDLILTSSMQAIPSGLNNATTTALLKLSIVYRASMSDEQLIT